MPTRPMTQDDPLDDFARREITLDDVGKVVHVAGQGPAVIVMAEMPGISPHVARFARWVRDAGFTVYMPSLFGRDGAVPMAEEGAVVLQRACVSVFPLGTRNVMQTAFSILQPDMPKADASSQL